MGRYKALDLDVVDKIERAFKVGYTAAEIARKFHVSEKSARRIHAGRHRVQKAAPETLPYEVIIARARIYSHTEAGKAEAARGNGDLTLELDPRIVQVAARVRGMSLVAKRLKSEITTPGLQTIENISETD